MEKNEQYNNLDCKNNSNLRFFYIHIRLIYSSKNHNMPKEQPHISLLIFHLDNRELKYLEIAHDCTLTKTILSVLKNCNMKMGYKCNFMILHQKWSVNHLNKKQHHLKINIYHLF